MATNQTTQTAQTGQTGAQGQGNYPVDNFTYDLMQVMVSKLESIEAYQKYMKDADQQGRQLFQEMMQQDQQAVQRIMGMLKQAFQRY